MLNLVLFGPPGAGKGTQSEYIVKKYKLIQISTGDLLRAEVAQETTLGLEAKTFMNAGKLVPDEVLIGMVANKIDTHPESTGFIFDGFPRTNVQAQALDEMLKQRNMNISTMIALEVDNEELTKRILKRGETSGRADDQNETLVRQRVEEYETKTRPVADFYQAQNKFQSIKGTGSIDEIFGNICSILDKHK